MSKSERKACESESVISAVSVDDQLICLCRYWEEGKEEGSGWTTSGK